MGLMDRQATTVYLDDDLLSYPPGERAAVAWHELAHVYERQKGLMDVSTLTGNYTAEQRQYVEPFATWAGSRYHYDSGARWSEATTYQGIPIAATWLRPDSGSDLWGVHEAVYSRTRSWAETQGYTSGLYRRLLEIPSHY